MLRLVINRVYTNIKITNNTKLNRIMVSFLDHYNSSFIDRVLYKQFDCTLIIPFQISLFLLICTKSLFQLKNVINNLSSTSN